MLIKGKEPKIKTHLLSYFGIGDVCLGADNGHYYLVVESENDKTQLVDLSDNKIIRDGRNIRLIEALAELNVKSVG